MLPAIQNQALVSTRQTTPETESKTPEMTNKTRRQWFKQDKDAIEQVKALLRQHAPPESPNSEDRNIAVAAEETKWKKPTIQRVRKRLLEERPPFQVDVPLDNAISELEIPPKTPSPVQSAVPKPDILIEEPTQEQPLNQIQVETRMVTSKATSSAERPFTRHEPKPPRTPLEDRTQQIQSILMDRTPGQVSPLSLLDYFIKNAFWDAFYHYRADAGVNEYMSNGMLLKHFMESKQFHAALKLVDKTPLDDLMYVIGKFAVIRDCELKDAQSAQEHYQIILPLGQEEVMKGGVRGDWFQRDLHLLDNLIRGPENNPYQSFDWQREMERFWDKSHAVFKQALIQFFPQVQCKDLTQVFQESSKIQKLQQLISSEPPSRPVSYVRPKVIREEGSAGSRRKWGSDRSDVSVREKQDMIPQSGDESCSFALANICGPSVGQIKVIDVTSAEGRLVCATTGGEERSDRFISIWDLKKDTLINNLDNQTSKPIVQCVFHPTFPELLLTGDLAGDVKLWNWQENHLVKHWKRHHSRIIFKIGFVPGDPTRAISCSGDQSCKIWNMYADKSTGGSVHANEPMTSFTFCGSETDPLQQKLIVSLSNSIRIYKLRTNIPISYIEAHPMYDHFVLISSDHQLRLLDLNTEQVIRTFNARQVDSRIKGKFSPGGNYVYCPSGDQKPNQRLPNSPEHYAQLIWKVSTGKLETGDIEAMEDGEKLMGDKKKSWQVFVSAGKDKLVRLYM
ncbi:WD40-repeat-containing domain protein [Gorgonomyces haynaldii]|nr:WD40-repeat-containing domain protein [Gorgonomyces haynaldii]